METAELLLANQRHYAASWFAQQAAEKALKAVYMERFGQVAPRTHDLEFLGVQLSVPTAVELQLDILNPAFDARYPGASPGSAPVDSVSPLKSQEHLTAAKEVLEWVRGQLP
jgi:HEPN domain-containing protein